MVSLTIGNSFSQLKNLDIAMTKKLRSVLSYEIQPSNPYNKNLYSQRCYLIDKKGVFPTGLLPLVKKIITENITIYDNRVKPSSKDGVFPTFNLPFRPYDEQTNIASAAALVHRGVISASTGFGKSVAMALIIHKLQVKTLVIVPNLTLKRQLTKSFKEIFGDLKNITIENIDSKSLKKKGNYDLLLIDEAHHAAAKTYRKLNKTVWDGIYYRFFFTATPFRSRNEENILLESIAGQVIHTVGYAHSVKNGYIVPVESCYIQLPKTKIDPSLTTYSQVYKKLVIQNEELNNVVCNMLLTLHNNRVPTLCIVKEIAHGEILANFSGVGFVNGAENNHYLISAFNSGRINCLIGTSGVLGEGVDTKPAEVVIIAGLGKSKPAFMQQVGRGVRRFKDKKHCTVVIFENPSHKWTKSHFKEQVKILTEEYNSIPVKIVLEK